MVNTDPARAPERPPQRMTVLAGVSDPAVEADEVRWLEEAEWALEAMVTDPAVRAQLRSTAGGILHNVMAEPRPRCVELGDAGNSGTVMWHRGLPDEHEWLENEWQTEQAEGPESYFLFYLPRPAGTGFEVVTVRSVSQMVQDWKPSRRQWDRCIRALKFRRFWSLRRWLPDR